MHCPRCGNSDPRLFFIKNGKYYCRACLKFNGRLAKIKKRIKPKIIKSNLSYKLSNAQDNASIKASSSDKDIYLDAVCGAGKTEIVFKSIEEAISNGNRVGFIIPRREVVSEIYERLKEVYPSLQITLVYGGHSEYLDGDIICLTCHQCYRYKDKFGLVILDEYDAFPLKGDTTLLNIVKKTCYGKIIYLSATFSKQDLLGKNSASIDRRYHGFDIPVPKTIITHFILIKLLKSLVINKNNVTLLFVPKISLGNTLYILLKFLGFKCILFTSKSIDKKQIYKSIKDRIYKVVICTTILERGITIRNVDVIVFKANHIIFDTSTLIQICGRVGRKIGAEEGNILYISKSCSNSMEESIKNIVNKNNGIK